MNGSLTLHGVAEVVLDQRHFAATPERAPFTARELRLVFPDGSQFLVWCIADQDVPVRSADAVAP